MHEPHNLTRSCEVEDLFTEKLHHCLGAGANVEFFVNSVEVRANGLNADEQLIGNFLVPIAFRKEGEDFFFTACEVLILTLGSSHSVKRLHDLPRDTCGHRGAAPIHLVDRFEKFCRRRSLQEVSVRARRQRIEDRIAVFVDGKHESLSGRAKFPELSHTVDAGHLREVDIHQDNVWPDSGKIPERILGVLVLAHTAKSIRSVDDDGKTLSYTVIVLDNRHFDGHAPI